MIRWLLSRQLSSTVMPAVRGYDSFGGRGHIQPISMPRIRMP